MQLMIEATSQVTTIDGVPVRLWNGVTEGGKQCQVYVHLISATDFGDTEEFDRELQEKMPPAEFVDFVKTLK